MAGVHTFIDAHMFGLDIKISGFSDSLQRLMVKIIDLLFRFDPSKEERQFPLLHNQLKLRFENFDKEQPYQITMFNATLALRKGTGFTNEERLAVISGMDFKEFLSLGQEWLKTVRFEWLVMGNLESERVKELVLSTEEKFRSSGAAILSKEDNNQIRTVKLPKNKRFFYEYLIKEPKQNNDDVQLTFQDRRGPKSRILCLLLENYLNAPFFQELRTKQQAGYIVYTMCDEDRGLHSISLCVQSDRFPSHLCAVKIQEFLDAIKEKLLNIEDAEFLTYKNSVMTLITEKDLNLMKEVSLQWFEVASHQNLFDRKEREAEILTGITREEFVAFARRLLWEEARVLEIHSLCQEKAEENLKVREERRQSGNLIEIESFKSFQSKMQLYPDFFSYFGALLPK